MLRVENVEVFNLQRSIVVSGYPMKINVDAWELAYVEDGDFEKDLARVKKLASVSPGTGHDNFLSGIQVVFDVTYPQYWSPEFQRYHFAQIVSSQSKMHRLCAVQKKDEFSKKFNKYVEPQIIDRVFELIAEYNDNKSYENFMRCVSNLPSGYEMTMHISTNYLQLKTMYHQRKNHKLKEDWGPFCKMIEELPYAKELILGTNGAEEAE